MRGRFVLLTTFLLSTTSILQAQILSGIKPDKPIVCYYSTKDQPSHIPPPEVYMQMRRSAAGRTQTASINVTYLNFSDSAKAAFQYAVDIWQTQIISPVQINIHADWSALDAGVLGQAIWANAYANFDNAPHINTYYPVALAEKIAGTELNATGDADINASFSSVVKWYYKTDGKTTSGKMDLVTVVLHEIAHGLGFTDTYSVTGTTGSVGLADSGTPVPFVYDLFVENASGKNLFKDFVSPSTSLKTQLTSAQLFYNTPLATAANGGHVKLYAPTTFNAGSSISHLDETTFPAGNINSLMTYAIAPMESIHKPGPLLLDIFSDMGWVFTRIEHTKHKDTERMDNNPYPITVNIQSDSTYDKSQVVLHYTSDSIHYTTVNMNTTGNTDQYAANLPGTITPIQYGYFITAKDKLRTYYNPGQVEQQNKQSYQSLFVFTVAIDTVKPLIAHTPIDYIYDTTGVINFTATVTDNIDVKNVKLEYYYNTDVANVKVVPMTENTPDVYKATVIPRAGLIIGDKIMYRIVATDVATNTNTRRSPSSEYYTIFVTGNLPARDMYTNNFNTPTFDFIGNSFSIKTVAGFSNGAIHSDHPYKDGSDANAESRYNYQLQIPIKINAGNPNIQFREVVLVEPGDTGSKFGDATFYDYVIVEGSTDHGKTWKPFIDGYDCRDNSDWLTRWNSNTGNNNSNAKGDSSLYKVRTINMLTKGNFKAGDEVLIHFQLFADQASHGWGWAIDNLNIQTPITGVVEEVINTLKFNLYPNPASEKIKIELNIPLASTEHAVALSIINIQGQSIFTKNYIVNDSAFSDEITINTWPSGLYFVKLEAGDKVFTKKFSKEK